MNVEGERVKEYRWIHAGDLAVKVQVEAVIPVDDPSEPCFEPHVVQWLDEVRQRAAAGDVAWLSRIGEVYVRQSV